MRDEDRLSDERSEIADRLSVSAKSWARPDALDSRDPQAELQITLDAMNELNARRVRIAELEAALKPFADMADQLAREAITPPTDASSGLLMVKYADLRRASAAIRG